MDNAYEQVTEEIKRKIAVSKEIKEYINDPAANEYNHINAVLGMKRLIYKHQISRLLKRRRLIRQGVALDDTAKQPWRQFDSCSYNELTMCIVARVIWIRESNNLLNNQALEKYKEIIKIVTKCRDNDKEEISKLLKMRRTLKKSGIKNWDSDKLAIS